MIYTEVYENEIGLFEIFKGIILPLLAVFVFELIYRDVLMDFSK